MDKPFTTAREVSEEFERRGLPGEFCHVPFTALILEPDGSVGSCRIKGTDFSIGNLNEQTLEEIWNGPKIRQWRREHLSGEIGFCKKEVRHSKCHTCPQYNTLLPQVDPVEVQTQRPLRIALNFNGKCNLQCRMCHIWKKPNGLYDSKGWWSQAAPWLESVREVELLSGEPFIQQDTYRLIDHLAEKNPDCLWSITTNGHWKLTDGIRAALDRIKIKHLIVSIDSLEPETYAKIRIGGDLKVVLQNLDRLIEYDHSRVERSLGSMNIRLSFLVQQDNWKELGRFHDFPLEKGVEVFRIFLYNPAEYSLLSIEHSEREAILDWYFANLTREQLLHSRRILLPLLDSLEPLARAAAYMKMKMALGQVS